MRQEITFVPAHPSRDGLLLDQVDGVDHVSIPSALWDSLPEPNRVVPTDPTRIPLPAAGILTWYGAHPVVPDAATFTAWPDTTADDALHAATVTVTGCMAASTLRRASAYRREAVTSIVPLVLRTLNTVLHAPPALSVALLTALTANGVLRNADWEEWALDRLGQDGLLDARELGYEATSLSAAEPRRVQDLVVETASRSRNQSPRPPESTPSPGGPAKPERGQGEPGGAAAGSGHSASTELATADSTSGTPNQDTTSQPIGHSPTSAGSHPEPAGAAPSPETGPPSSDTPPSSTPVTSVDSRSEGPAKVPEERADAIDAEIDAKLSTAANEPQDATGESALNSTNDRSPEGGSTPSRPAGTEPSEAAEEPESHAAPSSPTEPATESQTENGQSTEGTPDTDIPPGITAAANAARTTYHRRTGTIPKPKPSATALAKIKAQRAASTDRESGRRHLDAVFPPGEPTPVLDGQRTRTRGIPGRAASQTAITWHATLPEDRRTARRIATALRKAKVRAPGVVSHWTDEPPGRVDMRMAMQEDAYRDMGMDVTVPVFRQTRIQPSPEPDLAVGFAVDISGSMSWATTAAPAITWCILKAVHDIGGRTCAVRFSDYVLPLFSPGRIPNLIPEFATAGGSDHKYTEALHTLDAALHLQSTPADKVTKVIFIFSDGQFGPRQEKTGHALAERLHRRAGVRFIWVAVPPATPRAPGQFMSLAGGSRRNAGKLMDPSELPKAVADAVVGALANHRVRTASARR